MIHNEAKRIAKTFRPFYKIDLKFDPNDKYKLRIVNDEL